MDREITVLVFAKLDEHHIAQIQQVNPRVRVAAVTDRQKGIEMAPQAEVMVGWNVPREAVQRAPKLRWIRGKTIGVLGLGHIGTEIAEKAQVFGMRVIGTKYTPASVAGVDRVYPPEGLMEVLGEADVVVVALPLTTETRGLIGERELRMMKPAAIIINIGRGPIVQERALIRALQERWIGGAGLDVFEREPLPADSPLWGMGAPMLNLVDKTRGY